MIDPEPTPASTTTQRVERKYPLPDALLDAALAELRGILPVYHYKGDHDWSSIRTIYLDTPDLMCYQEYEKNLPVRRKIRLRQYGVDGRFEGLWWVELKVKNRNLSLKRRFCCGPDELACLMEGRDVLDRVAKYNPRDVSNTYHVIQSMIVEQHLVPAVRVDYERMSFQPPGSEDIRLTLDRDVRFTSPCMRFRGRLDGLIIEIKHHGIKPPWFLELRQRLGLKRARRFSKFARSIRQLELLREGEATT